MKKNNRKEKNPEQQYTKLVNNIISTNETSNEEKNTYHKNSLIYVFAIISILIIIAITVFLFVYLFKDGDSIILK
ncbi:hypothetical protein [Mycoplasmopsis cynos]|uniref:Uncharacterized protein n=1 Tax=Mycoplasmopsis cynos TaxID=171284 RepID=A0A449AIC8_9BACT|nr:hypothetical protein [Mycoplasmopsis cynos]TQC55093.1 hypothetical protein E1I74_00110 [Mycoplasmopsis cynos]VEU64764.1 Uncharacterised protein [Mycoplasmopsis cynos]